MTLMQLSGHIDLQPLLSAEETYQQQALRIVLNFVSQVAHHKAMYPYIRQAITAINLTETHVESVEDDSSQPPYPWLDFRDLHSNSQEGLRTVGAVLP